MSAIPFRDTSAQDRVIEQEPFWRRYRLRFAVGAAVGALLLVMLPRLAQQWSAEQSVSLTRLSIAAVERGRFVRDIATEGRIVAAGSPTLYAAAAGTITFAVEAGTPVRQDDLLGTLDSPELSYQLAQEKSALQELSLQYDRAVLDSRQQTLAVEEQVTKARIDRDVALTEHQRTSKAFELKVISEIDAVRSQAVLGKMEAAYQNLESSRDLQRDSIKFNVDAARLVRDRKRLVVADLQRQVELLKLRSPVSGQVGQLLVAERAYVAKDVPLISVVDLTALEIELNVPESLARDLAAGMTAQISSSGREYKGEVSTVSPQVVAGEVTARVRFVGPLPAGLRQSQRVSVRVLLDAREDVLMVTRGPFAESGGTAYVVSGEFAERRALQLGTRSIDKVEIMSGARPGDRIVIAGADNFGGARRVLITK
jgi:HlyD family secretion protein